MPHGTVSTCPSANAEPMSSAMSMRAFPWSPSCAAQSRHFAVGGQAGGRRAHAGPGIRRPGTGQGAHRARPRSRRSRTPERNAGKAGRSGRTARLRITGPQDARARCSCGRWKPKGHAEGMGALASAGQDARAGPLPASLPFGYTMTNWHRDEIAAHSLFSAPARELFRRSTCSRDPDCLIPRENHAMGSDLAHENPPKQPLRPFEPVSCMRGRSSGLLYRHLASPQPKTPREPAKTSSKTGSMHFR